MVYARASGVKARHFGAMPVVRRHLWKWQEPWAWASLSPSVPDVLLDLIRVDGLRVTNTPAGANRRGFSLLAVMLVDGYFARLLWGVAALA